MEPEPLSLADLLNRPGWQRDALCTEYSDVSWFPEKGESLEPAKAVCARCLCRSDCLEYAIANGIDHGVWAGLSPKARKQMRRQQAA